MKDIDRIDRAILRTLQTEGRIANVELARRINLSPTPCLERVRRLEKSGYIQSYAARLDPMKLELGTTVFVQATLDRTTTDVFDRFSEAVRRTPNIVECHMIAGGFDYLLKVRVSDMNAFRIFLGEVINNLPGLASTSTYVAMESVTEGDALPIAEARP